VSGAHGAAPAPRVLPHAARAYVLSAAAMADDVPALLSGMARYEKGIVIGEGTFGVVFKALDRLVRGAAERAVRALCRAVR
jgi:hypothetical protein